MGANALCYLFRKTMITLIVMMNDYSGYWEGQLGSVYLVHAWFTLIVELQVA